MCFYSLCRPSCYQMFDEAFWNLSEPALEEDSLERQQRQILVNFSCQFDFNRVLFHSCGNSDFWIRIWMHQVLRHRFTSSLLCDFCDELFLMKDLYALQRHERGSYSLRIFLFFWSSETAESNNIHLLPSK